MRHFGHRLQMTKIECLEHTKSTAHKLHMFKIWLKFSLENPSIKMTKKPDMFQNAKYEKTADFKVNF